MIFAVNKQNAIGYKGVAELPWHFSEDLKHFKETTSGHAILMGKDTFLSIGLLPNRKHYVLSTELGIKERYPDPSIKFGNDLDKLIKLAEEDGNEELFIIGGAGVINQCVNKVTTIYRTKIPGHELEGNLALINPIPSEFTRVGKSKLLPNGLVFDTLVKQ